MTQLVERSLTTPDVRGLNPVIGEIYLIHLFTINLKDENKEKAPGMAHFKKSID